MKLFDFVGQNYIQEVLKGKNLDVWRFLEVTIVILSLKLQVISEYLISENLVLTY